MRRPLREEIENLRRRVAESEDAASRARREAEEHARARESVEERLTREAEDATIWEKLAQQAEAEKMAESAAGCWRSGECDPALRWLQRR